MRRLGSTRAETIDVQIIAASNEGRLLQPARAASGATFTIGLPFSTLTFRRSVSAQRTSCFLLTIS